jgi:hypothetical protein
LVDYLSKLGKRVTVLGPGRGPTSIELIRASDHYENLDDIEGVVVARYPYAYEPEVHPTPSLQHPEVLEESPPEPTAPAED